LGLAVEKGLLLLPVKTLLLVLLLAKMLLEEDATGLGAGVLVRGKGKLLFAATRVGEGAGAALRGGLPCEYDWECGRGVDGKAEVDGDVVEMRRRFGDALFDSVGESRKTRRSGVPDLLDEAGKAGEA
jgi:hypothetical protein